MINMMTTVIHWVLTYMYLNHDKTNAIVTRASIALSVLELVLATFECKCSKLRISTTHETSLCSRNAVDNMFAIHYLSLFDDAM